MTRPFSELSQWVSENSPIGVFADTTILFSATYPPDLFNAESEAVFGILARARLPVFVSVNVKAEFLENHRRAAIADSLVDFVNDMHSHLDGPLLLKLQSHKKMHKEKADEGRNTRLDVNQIKVFRSLLKDFASGGIDGWKILCRKYLRRQFSKEWADAERELSLNFISTRTGDSSELMGELPSWERAIDIIGEYGLSSSDAMILNMFLCSKIPALLTSDMELAEVANAEANGKKTVFVPDSLLT